MTAKKITEENPFEDEAVAKQWISSVENERGAFRDKEIYPRLRAWKAQSGAATILEIGSGQGICSDKIALTDKENYLGVEPSAPLVARAKTLYVEANRQFLTGSAYDLPIKSSTIDGAFSTVVWLHLENLQLACEELSRVLKSDGHFLIITANPEAYDGWTALFTDFEKDDKKIVGTVSIPNNPLARNVIYFHSMDEIIKALQTSGLSVLNVEAFGGDCDATAVEYFIEIKGQKIGAASGPELGSTVV